MRRSKIVTNKIIILVILSGFFNLLSYAFDQMVIQSEFKNRELERKLVENKVKLETLSYEINTLNDLNLDIVKSTRHFRHHFGINLFMPSLFFSISRNSKLKEVFNESISEEIGNDHLKKLKNIIPDFNNKVDELSEILITVVPKMNEVIQIDKIKINPNLLDYYNPYPLDDAKEQTQVDVANYEHYSQIYKKIDKFKDLSFYVSYFLEDYEEIYIQQFSSFFSFLDTYTEQNNKINYYILLSIVSQILGILFILILFKSILVRRVN